MRRWGGGVLGRGRGRVSEWGLRATGWGRVMHRIPWESSIEPRIHPSAHPPCSVHPPSSQSAPIRSHHVLVVCVAGGRDNGDGHGLVVAPIPQGVTPRRVGGPRDSRLRGGAQRALVLIRTLWKHTQQNLTTSSTGLDIRSFGHSATHNKILLHHPQGSTFGHSDTLEIHNKILLHHPQVSTLTF